MAAEGEGEVIPVWYLYRGEEGEIIPRDATHILVDKSCTLVRAHAFLRHPNIVEVICHDKVKRIEECAFFECPRLRRVIMPGVKIIEEDAFFDCGALTDVECDKLEIIKEGAFKECESLRSINLPSAKIVEQFAFSRCKALTDVKFGSKLERIEGEAFFKCTSLERITIPLRDGIINADGTFQACENLKHVDLIEDEEGELHETIAALHLEEWRNEMNEEIDSINRILPTSNAGFYDDFSAWDDGDNGEKARVIRTWIRTVLGKIINYQAEHQRFLNEGATTLQHVLPQDIVMNNVLSFLELPSHTFEVEGDEDEDNRDSSYSEGSSSEGEESEMEEDDREEQDE